MYDKALVRNVNKSKLPYAKQKLLHPVILKIKTSEILGSLIPYWQRENVNARSIMRFFRRCGVMFNKYAFKGKALHIWYTFVLKSPCKYKN